MLAVCLLCNVNASAASHCVARLRALDIVCKDRKEEGGQPVDGPSSLHTTTHGEHLVRRTHSCKTQHGSHTLKVHGRPSTTTPRQFVHLQPPFKHFLQHPKIREKCCSPELPQHREAPIGDPPETTFFPNNFLTPQLFAWSLSAPPWIPRTLHGAMQLQTELTRVLATSCTHQHIQHIFASCWQWVVSSETGQGPTKQISRCHRKGNC